MKLEYLYEVFEAMPRQGPGSDEFTDRALRRLQPLLPLSPRVLDIGCGSGAQTKVLAEHLNGNIVAVDNHRRFLVQMQHRLQRCGCAHRVTPVVATMFRLPFEDRGFNLVWSEGAIYLMGLEEGLGSWRRLLAPGGVVAISDCVWLSGNPPPDVRAFWETESPGMQNIEGTRARIESCGYQIIDHFVLPPQSWEESYYLPLERQLETFIRRHSADSDARSVYTELTREIALFRVSRGSFSYVLWLLSPLDPDY